MGNWGRSAQRRLAGWSRRELEHPDTDHDGALTDHSERSGIEPAPAASL
jgi:hypothetical protein